MDEIADTFFIIHDEYVQKWRHCARHNERLARFNKETARFSQNSHKVRGDSSDVPKREP
jgi:hypothetical protein